MPGHSKEQKPRETSWCGLAFLNGSLRRQATFFDRDDCAGRGPISSWPTLPSLYYAMGSRITPCSAKVRNFCIVFLVSGENEWFMQWTTVEGVLHDIPTSPLCKSHYPPNDPRFDYFSRDATLCRVLSTKIRLDSSKSHQGFWREIPQSVL